MIQSFWYWGTTHVQSYLVSLLLRIGPMFQQLTNACYAFCRMICVQFVTINESEGFMLYVKSQIM